MYTVTKLLDNQVIEIIVCININTNQEKIIFRINSSAYVNVELYEQTCLTYLVPRFEDVTQIHFTATSKLGMSSGKRHEKNL